MCVVDAPCELHGEWVNCAAHAVCALNEPTWCERQRRACEELHCRRSQKGGLQPDGDGHETSNTSSPDSEVVFDTRCAGRT
jgi:hypothetical protein